MTTVGCPERREYFSNSILDLGRGLQSCPETFSPWSGLKINWGKSEGMEVGTGNSVPPDKRWINVVNKMKILGVVLRAQNNSHTRYYDNFKDILEKMRAILYQWKNRNLSLKGKTVVVNSLIISLLSYMSSVIYTPPRVICETKSMICKYIWSGNHNKISYSSLIKKIEHGGLKLADLDTRIKASYVQWVKRMVNTKGCINTELAKVALKWPYDIKRLFQSKRTVQTED